MSGDVTVISGPTAVGKGTVVQALKARHPEVWVSVSATTRPPRPTEVDGVHYHFVSNADFDVLVATDGLLEWATVHGRDRYGTPSAPVEAAVERGERVILEIDLQGAR
ncbi:MAG: guanylate kinase, partial [Propionibacteriaceae bacterium]|nr:guanylate kinase [Propionibacteriaceae bacterium]